jgi:hypothetical protein
VGNQERKIYAHGTHHHHRGLSHCCCREFVKKANSEGEAALAQLSQANPAFPADLDENTITALYNDTNWAAIVFGIAAIVAFVVAILPPIKDAMKRPYAITAAVMGAIMLLVGIFATIGGQWATQAICKMRSTRQPQQARFRSLSRSSSDTVGSSWSSLDSS